MLRAEENGGMDWIDLIGITAISGEAERSEDGDKDEFE